MSKTRFTQGMVLLCIATVAACTSTGSDEGPSGNTELNVVLPDPESTDVQSVEYTICCDGSGTTDGYLDNDLNFDDAVCINGNVEVIEDPAGIPGSDLTNAEVRQGYMDLAPGACTVELRARDNDGEVICTDKDGFVVTADGTTTVNQTLFCGLSFQADVGNAIVIADFSYNVANFCPDLFVLNCLESMPTSPTADPATTTCEVRYRDGDEQCGESCDPQTCSPVLDGPGGQATGLDCSPATDPGVSTDITCNGGTITACTNGTIHSDGSCSFAGDQIGTLFADTNGNQVVPNPATFDVSCAGANPGATITCMARTTDGDTDCDKTKVVSFDCPGLDACDPAATPTPPDCTVTGGECVNEVCDSSTGTAMCVFDSNVPAGGGNNCDYQGVPGQPGECDGNGNCAQFGCGSDPECDDGNECTVPPGGACDTGTGTCCGDGVCDDELLNVADGTPCSGGTGQCESPSGGTVPNDSVCVDSCTLVGPTACDDGAPDGECTSNVCTSADGLCGDGGAGLCANGDACTVDLDCLCSNPPITDCDACCDSTGGGANTENCRTGVCTPPPPAATCDPSGQGGVPAECQSLELLALDCYLLGSGAPLILDPRITQTAPAFGGVDVAVVPLQALALPGSLVCGFASVLPGADVYNSFANLVVGPPGGGVTPTNIGLNSWLGTPPTSPHAAEPFSFSVGCGDQAGACGAVNAGLCNESAVSCTADSDCAGTGPGVVVPFASGAPLGAGDPPGAVLVNAPAGNTFVSFSYGFNDVEAYVSTAIGTLCLGGSATNPPNPLTCAFSCDPSDRTGDSVPPFPFRGQPITDPDPDDSPRIMKDGNCDKLGVAACGGTACDTDSEPCPLAAIGQQCQAVNGTAGFCLNVNTGSCQTTCFIGSTNTGVTCSTDDDCDPVFAANDIPTCCEPYFDYSAAANVCGTGQPGSSLATTEAPCNGETGTSAGGVRCEGRVSCGSCQQVTGDAPLSVFTPGVDCPESPVDCLNNPPCDPCPWPTVEFCSAIPGSPDMGLCENSDGQIKCPNGDSDCTDGDDDYCIVPCGTNTCGAGDRIGDLCLRDIDCQRCTGGANDNGNCTVAADCLGACQGGTNDGEACAVAGDCIGECAGAPAPCTADVDCGPFGPCVDAGNCGAAGTCDANAGTCDIVGCNSDSCCAFMSNFPNATLTDFPLMPVN